MKNHFLSIACIFRECRILTKLICLCCAVLVSACATDSDVLDDGEEIQLETKGSAKLKQLIKMHNRLDRVGGKLLINNANLCKKQLRNLLGFSVENKYTYSKRMAALAEDDFNLDDRLRIRNVIPGSGAQRAGLRRGDILTRIGTRPAPKGSKAEQDVVKMLSSLISKSTTLNMSVQRGKNTIRLTIPLTPACGFRIELAETADVNAYSDGTRILITQGMMVFAKSDESLAYVISKEMAHNVLGHAQALNNTHAMTTLIDNMLQVPPRTSLSGFKLNPMTKKYDIDADTLSLAMSLRAGYNIDHATTFWKRLASRFPPRNPRNYTALHPETNARLEALPKSITRIKEIDKRRKALAVPNNTSSKQPTTN